MTEYKMQLLCLCLLLFMGVYHLGCKRLHTTTVKLFDHIIAISILNLVFDIITVFTVNHLEQVPPILNRLAHQIFIGSLDIYIFLVCTYIIYVARCQKHSSRVTHMIFGIPLILSLIIVAFGPIYYNLDQSTGYSYGGGVTTCYVSVLIYVIIALYFCFHYWHEFDHRKRTAILPALFIMIAITVIQGFYPESLISGMGVTLMVFSIFITLENPSDYIDKKSGVYNEQGFSTVIGEVCAKECSFSIISIYIKNINVIRSDFGLRIENQILHEMKEALYRKYHQDLFITYDGCISIVIRKDKEIADEIEVINHYLSKGIKVLDNYIMLDYEIHTITNKECKGPEQGLALIIDEANRIAYTQVYLDRSTGVSNRNAYEKDIDLIFGKRNQLRAIWYVIIDLNNLKYVNDTYGHSEGDKFLRDCANILIKYSDINHRVYRIGGDEFCMIILDQTEFQVEDTLAKMEMERQAINRERELPISFALGYSGYRQGVDHDLSEVKIRADKMMYQIKHIMKNNR